MAKTPTGRRLRKPFEFLHNYGAGDTKKNEFTKPLATFDLSKLELRVLAWSEGKSNG